MQLITIILPNNDAKPIIAVQLVFLTTTLIIHTNMFLHVHCTDQLCYVGIRYDAYIHFVFSVSHCDQKNKNNKY